MPVEGPVLVENREKEDVEDGEESRDREQDENDGGEESRDREQEDEDDGREESRENEGFLRVLKRRRGQKTEVKKVRAMQKNFCQVTKDSGQRSSLIKRETQLFADWSIKILSL